LVLVRHGETDWNVERRVQGHSDTPLNENGREQARKLSATLGLETFDLVVSSDLDRAKETAWLSLPEGTPIAETADLRELNFGDWEGLTGPEIEVEAPGGLSQTWRGWGEAPNGESLVAFAERIERVVRRLRAEVLEGSSLVVAHGGTLRVFICLAMGLPVDKAWQFQLANTAVSELELFADGAILSKLNDTAHLR
jgi:broad specificity phosphatase PhoE